MREFMRMRADEPPADSNFFVSHLEDCDYVVVERVWTKKPSKVTKEEVEQLWEVHQDRIDCFKRDWRKRI